MEAIHSLFALQWSQKPKLHPLPANILRDYVDTAGGNPELLVARPDLKGQKEDKRPPIFFIHGGEGHAAVWLEWMEYLSTRYSANTYAYSMRCHGVSYVVPYWKLVCGTSFEALASDLAECLKEACKRKGQDPIILAHSSDGGLAQYVLSRGLAKARALVLVGTVPHWGKTIAYWN